MKRAIKSAFFLALLLPIFVFGKAISPSILPSNPFYFAKESVRNLRRAFTFNYTGKADLELRIADERLAEIQKLVDLNMDDKAYLSSAITNYKNNLQLLKDHVGLVKEINPNIIDPFLDKLASWYLRHGLAFSHLPNEQDKVKNDLAEIVASTIGRLQTFDAFRSRIKAVVSEYKEDYLFELKTAELLSYLERFLLSRDSWLGWTGLKEDLLIAFADRIGRGQLPFRSLENLTENPIARLKLMDEAREKVYNLDIKSQIGIIRQQLLDKYEANGLINNHLVSAEINHVQGLLSGADIKKENLLLEQIKYSLNQAKKSLSTASLKIALGQVSLANALVNNFLWELYLDADVKLKEVMILRVDYDGLREENKNILIEEKIAELSELVKDNSLSNKVISSIREIKLMLAHAR